MIRLSKGGNLMVTIRVRLFGRLVLGRHGRGRQAEADGTFLLTLGDGDTVADVINAMRVPASRVGLTLVNAHICAVETPLSLGDRVVLVPTDLAALWPARLRQDLTARMVRHPLAPIPARGGPQKRLAAT
jgi:hypothetical protein